MNIFGLVVELLSQAHFSVVGANLEGVTALVLERVVDDSVVAAIHVLGLQLQKYFKLVLNEQR